MAGHTPGDDGDDGSGESYLDRAEGRDLTELAKQGVGGWLLAVSGAAITGTQDVIDLLVFTPVDVMIDVIEASGEAVFEDPLGVVSSGAEDTAASVGDFGFLALPVGTAIVLGTMYMVTQYLSREDTSDLFVGGVSDYIPFVGADGEEEN